MLNLVDLSLRRGRELLLAEATVTIHAGERVGLVGANGTGKSSLFALIRGELSADQGHCSLPDSLVLAHVAQHTPADDRPALDYVLDGDAELRRIEQQIADAEANGDGNRLGELHGRLEQIGGYSARARAAQLIHGLGFQPGDEFRPVTDFSGGWRMRLNLGQALMCRSDVLLLDEPTNHLDLDAVLWLQDWLRSYPGTLLLISHDRDVLDAVCDRILHLEHQRLHNYSGNYSDFERQRGEQLRQQQAAHEKQQREMAHMQDFVRRFRAQATKARQAQSRLKALERMETIAAAHIDSPFRFGFRTPAALPRPLMVLRDAAVGYADKPLLRDLNMNLQPGERIGLLGRNGAGKTTLMRLLAGEQPLLGGERTPAQQLAMGYFAQHQLEQLDPAASPLLHLQRLDPKAREQELRNFLGGFGFQGDMATTACAPFSGGEKARLVLAMLVYQRPNLLLLDEPTNHLDLDMRQALSVALQEFDGALVVIAHDRHLLRTTTDRLLLVSEGRLTEFEGDLDDYARWLADARRGASSNGNAGKVPATASAGERRERRKQAAQRRKELAPLRQAVQKLEREQQKLSEQQNALNTRLADSALYDAERGEELQDLLQQQGALQQRLEQIEHEWMERMQHLEQAEGET